MKKQHTLVLFVFVIALLSMTNKKKHFNEGVYFGESRSKYTSEPFWGQATVEIKNDRIIKMTFQIVDKSLNEVFGSDYEQHFKNNPEYIHQCRSDLQGIKIYIKKYLETKNIEKVDAITGATWSYNIFKDALNVALEKAKVL